MCSLYSPPISSSTGRSGAVAAAVLPSTPLPIQLLIVQGPLNDRQAPIIPKRRKKHSDLDKLPSQRIKTWTVSYNMMIICYCRCCCCWCCMCMRLPGA